MNRRGGYRLRSVIRAIFRYPDGRLWMNRARLSGRAQHSMGHRNGSYFFFAGTGASALSESRGWIASSIVHGLAR
jgi:hypothetical protein